MRHTVSSVARTSTMIVDHGIDMAGYTILGVGNEVGIILPFPKSTPPTGWLYCNAAAISRTTYAALYAVIGTTFGVGDGSTTFNLPDLRAATVMGYTVVDADYNAIGKVGGEKTHTLTTAELASHAHPLLIWANATGTDNLSHAGSGNSDAGTTTHNPTPQGLAGGGGAHENRPPFITLMWCIRY